MDGLPEDILLFGATGMVGQGVLRECLRDPEVERVLVIGRSSIGIQNEKARASSKLRYSAVQTSSSFKLRWNRSM